MFSAILVYKLFLIAAVCEVGVSYIKGNLVVLVKIIPDFIGKFVNTVGDSYSLGLTLKCRDRVAVRLLCMDKVTEPCL